MMYPDFANSFLLLIGKEKKEAETIYVKFSNETDLAFSVRTEICENSSGRRYVRKLPTEKTSEEHVKNLEKISRELGTFY